jgi:hypothetical protein
MSSFGIRWNAVLVFGGPARLIFVVCKASKYSTSWKRLKNCWTGGLLVLIPQLTPIDGSSSILSMENILKIWGEMLASSPRVESSSSRWAVPGRRKRRPSDAWVQASSSRWAVPGRRKRRPSDAWVQASGSRWAVPGRRKRRPSGRLRVLIR